MTSKNSDDTRQAGFVSTIVMKFSQLAQGKDKQLLKFNENKQSNIDSSKDLTATRLDKPHPLVFELENLVKSESDPPQSASSNTSTYSVTKEQNKFIETAKTQLHVEPKFEVVGEVSVKDRIKAYVALTSAFSRAAKSPGLIHSSVNTQNAREKRKSSIIPEASIDSAKIQPSESPKKTASPPISKANIASDTKVQPTAAKPSTVSSITSATKVQATAAKPSTVSSIASDTKVQAKAAKPSTVSSIASDTKVQPTAAKPSTVSSIASDTKVQATAVKPSSAVSSIATSFVNKNTEVVSERTSNISPPLGNVRVKDLLNRFDSKPNSAKPTIVKRESNSHVNLQASRPSSVADSIKNMEKMTSTEASSVDKAQIEKEKSPKHSQEHLEEMSPEPSSEEDPRTSKTYDFAKASAEFDEQDSPVSPRQLMHLSSGDEDISSVSSNILDEFDNEAMLNELGEDYHPLPKSYEIILDEASGTISIVLPPPPAKKCLKTQNLQFKTTRSIKNINIDENKIDYFETYSPFEYERGDEDLDPLTASAEYEIEKKTEQLVKFQVELTKDEKGLGLSIVGIGLGSDMGAEKLGIYIKALTPGGAAERSNKLNVHDQLLEVDGVSLVGVTQALAAQTLKSTNKVVKFLIGREKDQVE